MNSAGATGPVEVAAGIVVSHGRVLLCHRSADRSWYPNVWDLPGGHLEPGERPQSALVRELREELGIVVAEPATPEFSRLVTSDFDMRVWIVTEWDGTPVNASPGEHDRVAWTSPGVVATLPLAHPRYPSLIADALASR